MATTETEQEIDAYVRRLLWALQALPHDDRLNIASEIHGHLAEYATRGADAFERALARMGSPDALARSYVEEFELAGAVNRASPVTLLLNILNRGTRSILAFIVGLVALSLYGVAAACALVAVAKFISPANVGAWKGEHFAGAGIMDVPPAGAHELLGYWIVPVALVIALLCFLGAGKALRLVGRRLLARGRSAPGT